MPHTSPPPFCGPQDASAHWGAAALALEIIPPGGTEGADAAAAPRRLRVVPDGEFAAVDGRPGNLPGVRARHWRMDGAIAAAVVQRFVAQGVALPIDYEHQTLKAQDSGQVAPAAGWIEALHYVRGTGLVADVRWTPRAAAMLAAQEYRYISPVLMFDPDSGAVQMLHSVALTNTPALGRLGEIEALVRKVAHPGCISKVAKEENHMDKTKVLVALGLPLDTGDDSALTALTALAAQARQQQQEIAQLRAAQFDPAKHVPMDEHRKVCDALAALEAQGEAAEHERLMQAALQSAKILPPNEGYWRVQPLAALRAFLKDAKPLAALGSGTQTQGLAPAQAGSSGGAVDAHSLAAAALKFQQQQQAAGLNITTVQAVAHVAQQAAQGGGQ